MFRFFLNGPFVKGLGRKDPERGGNSSKKPFSERGDISLLGGVAGAMGFLTRDIYSFFAKIIGIAKFFVWNISAGLFMDSKFVPTFLGNLVGLLADTVFGAIIGIGFVYFLKYTNTKNYFLKAWGFGMAVWLLLFGIVFHNIPGTKSLAPNDALSNISAFIGHSILGISMGMYAKILLGEIGVRKLK